MYQDSAVSLLSGYSRFRYEGVVFRRELQVYGVCRAMASASIEDDNSSMTGTSLLVLTSVKGRLSRMVDLGTALHTAWLLGGYLQTPNPSLEEPGIFDRLNRLD